MDNKLFLLQNITVAVRSRNILQRAGIQSYIQKTPKFNNKANCGYSIFVPQRADDALRILLETGITVLDVIKRDVF